MGARRGKVKSKPRTWNLNTVLEAIPHDGVARCEQVDIFFRKRATVHPFCNVLQPVGTFPFLYDVFLIVSREMEYGSHREIITEPEMDFPAFHVKTYVPDYPGFVELHRVPGKIRLGYPIITLLHPKTVLPQS